MTMKQNIIHTLWAAALLLTACQQEELPLPGADNAAPLAITVTDGGYASTDKATTRATENGYRTEFAAGDQCGLYIVRGGAVVCENIELTAAEGTEGGLVWQPEAGVTLVGGFPDEKYFLYYPYQADMTGKVTTTATDDADFFATLISGRQPAPDQRDYATGYTASDLMTAKGTASKADGKVSLSYAMTHRMALAVIEMPKTVYKFTDESIPEYVIASKVDFSGDAKPYSPVPGTYRYLVRPGQTADSPLTGSYDGGKKEFTLTPSGIDTGNYKTYKVDGAAVTEKTHDLQPGDYLCKNSDGNWYIIPGEEMPNEECIAIVFYVDRHEKDNSDYTKPLTDGGSVLADGTVHGYAVALTDVHNDQNDRLRWEWGPAEQYDQVVNASTDNTDWNGYANCLKIHDFVKNNTENGWEMKHFPAALACETYGNRTVDRDGNPITDGRYDWQQPFIAPNNSSGWFLPSCSQLYYLYQNITFLSNCINAVKNKTVDATLKNHIGWFSTNEYYWSSTERSSRSGNAWYVYFAYDYRNARYKGSADGVRAVLAF